MKKILALAAMVAAGSASAASISYDFTNHAGAAFGAGYSMETTNWGSFANPILLTLPKFDSALGTLTSVSFTYGGGYQSQGQIDSEDAAQTFVTVDTNVALRFMSGDLGMGVQTLNVAGNLFNGLLDADSDAAPDYLGGDAAAGLSVAQESGMTPFASALANFIGNAGDTFEVGAWATSGLSINGTANLSTDITTQARARIAVTYNYDTGTTVPEPATLGLLGLGLIGLGLARRRKTA